MTVRYAAALWDAEVVDESPSIMWLCGDCRAFMALTLGQSPDTFTSMRTIGVVRRPEAERDGVPAFGLRDRARRRPELATRYGTAARRNVGKSFMAALDHLDPDDAEAPSLLAKMHAKAEFALFAPELFDTWCHRCGARNRIDLPRARRLRV